jgi:lipopolysaccharide export system permease protein
VLVLASLGALTTGYLLFEVEPHGHHRLRARLRELGPAAGVIQPGRFRTLGKRTFYVQAGGGPACPLEGVLIGDFSRAERPLYVSARCGQVAGESAGEALELALLDGAVQFSEDSEDRYRAIRFDRMRMRVDLESYLNTNRRARDLTFFELLDLDSRQRRGERTELAASDPVEVSLQIHRRLALPLASLLLALIALPLGVRPLRAGRSAATLTAIALMGAYWVLFTLAERATEGGFAPAWLALWLPDVLVAAIGIYLLRRSVRGEA